MVDGNSKKGIKETFMSVYSVLLSRANLAARLGQQYGGSRDIYEALGYELEVTYPMCAAQYERQDIAAAIINRPVEATWRGGVSLMESADEEDTPLEKEWDLLNSKLKLSAKFARLDRLAGLGHYGALLLGLDDVVDAAGFAQPVSSGEHKLLYVKGLSEGGAAIKDYEAKTSDPRFGLPIFYTVVLKNPSGGTTTDVKVHHSRVIHVPSGAMMESEIESVPRLKPVFNRLKDLEKLIGGSAEMFWRGARPGYQGKVDPKYKMTTEVEDDIQDQIDEYEHNLRRILIMEGAELQSLASQVSDPTPHVDVQLQMISAVTGIPRRILTGSERGELASSQDRANWFELVQARREEYAEPHIFRPFVDAMTLYKVLPEPKDEYSTVWSDLWAPSEKEKVDVGKVRTESLKLWGESLSQDTVPPEAFYQFCWGLNKAEIELIDKMREAALEEDQDDSDLDEDLETQE